MKIVQLQAVEAHWTFRIRHGANRTIPVFIHLNTCQNPV